MPYQKLLLFACAGVLAAQVSSAQIKWGTYYGGAATEDGYGVATDAAGNVYMTGYSLSTNNIATAGSHQPSFVPGPFSALDAYLVKFDSTGVRQWGTYYGNSGGDVANCIAIDPWGYVYIAGQTSSILAGTANGSQPNFAGGTDAFLAKFSPSGTLVWSTYYGGISPAGITNADYAFAVTCDKAGNVYIAGQTNSMDNIASPGSHQPALAGDADAFVAKFDSAGVRQWGTYLGGPAFDQARGLVVDASGNVYISGGGQSTTGIASIGSDQETLTAFSDGFLVKFNAAGVYQWGTYAGGAGYDGLSALTCDEEQNIYAAGTMGDNSNGLATNAGHQISAGGNGDAFLAKYDSAGVKMWATYYGGTGNDAGSAVKYDSFGNIYLSGHTKSTGSIATAGAHQSSFSGNSSLTDAFLAKFTKEGTRVWGTYYGGSNNDYARSIALHEASGAIYFSGQTKSPNNIVAATAHQDTLGNINSTDAFLVKFYECPSISNLNLSAINGPDSICPQSQATYSVTKIPGTNTYEWTLPSGWTGSSDSSSILVTTGVSGGNIQVRAVNSCDSTDFTTGNIYVYPFFPPTITVDSLTLGTASPYLSYQWILNGQEIAGATNSTYHVTQNGDYRVAVVSADGCTDTSEIYVVNNASGSSIDDTDLIKDKIRVYPVPTSDVLHIETPIPVNIALTALDGKVLQSYKGVTTIPLSNIAAGIYLLRITDTKGAFLKTEKVIKK